LGHAVEDFYAGKCGTEPYWGENACEVPVMPHAAEKATAQVAETIHRIPRVTSALADVVEGGFDAAKRVGKRSSDAAEELMDDTAVRVKRHPVESVVTAFAIGFIVGGFVDWLTRRKSYSIF
jgi:hypothetical protein